MKKSVLILSALLVSGLGFKANAQTDAQKAAAEAAKAISEAPVETPVAPKPTYWTRSLMTNLNFIQSSYKSWAKGGYDNISMSAYVDAKASYKKNSTSWTNRLQLDYGFLYSEDKPIFQKNKDRMLLESTWGYKAAKSLDYAAKFTFLSQFTDGYTYGTPSGDNPSKKDWRDARILKSGLLSPATVSLGLGMDWKPGPWLSVNFSPLTGGFTIVAKEQLRTNYGMERRKKFKDETVYPITKDDHGILTNGDIFRPARFEFGAQFTADAKVTINKNFEANTHLLLFSNYLDNPLNLRVNWDTRFIWRLAKYFTLNLSTNLIYDDKVLIVEEDYPNGHKAVQFYEALQFGFSYTFASKKK